MLAINMYSEQVDPEVDNARKQAWKGLLYVTLLTISVIVGRYAFLNVLIDYSQFNWDLVEQVNITGLPDDVDIKVYPKNHYITGEYFQIVYENNEGHKIGYGHEYSAEKWVNGRWVKIRLSGKGWDDQGYWVDAYSMKTEGKYLDEPRGIYRITNPFGPYKVRFIIVKDIQKPASEG